MHIRKLKNIYLISLIPLLSSCLSHTNPEKYKFLLNKERRLEHNLFIVDIGATRPWGQNIRWLESSSVPPCSIPKGSCVPNLHTYQANSAIWHQWYGNFDYRQRIVGALPYKTRYHVSKITEPGAISDATTELYITIDSGKYKGQEFRSNSGILNRMILSHW